MVEQNLEDLIWGFATIKYSTTIYEVPHWKSLHWKLPKSKVVEASVRVFIVGRDKYFRWVNIILEHPDGRNRYGWVHLTDLSGIKSKNGEPTDRTNIPLTEFQLNVRVWIRNLTRYLANHTYRYNWSAFNIFLLIASLYLPVVVLVPFGNLMNISLEDQENYFGILWTILMGVCIWLVLKKVRNEGKKKYSSDYLTNAERQAWLKDILDHLKRTEKTSDKIGQFLGALGTIAVVAGTAVVAASVAKAASEQSAKTQQNSQQRVYIPPPQPAPTVQTPQKIWVKCDKCNGNGSIWGTYTSRARGAHKDASVRAVLGQDDETFTGNVTCDKCNGQKGWYKQA